MHLNASENMVGKLLSSHLNATALRGDNGWAEIKLRTFSSPKDYSDAILRMVVAYSAGTRSTPQIIQRIHQGAKCSPPYKPDIKPNARDSEVDFQRTIQMLKRLNGTAWIKLQIAILSFHLSVFHFHYFIFLYCVCLMKKENPISTKTFCGFSKNQPFQSCKICEFTSLLMWLQVKAM